MKRNLLYIVAFLIATAATAQGGMPRNQRLSALVAMEDNYILLDSIKTLKNSNNKDDLQLLINYYAVKRDAEKKTK